MRSFLSYFLMSLLLVLAIAVQLIARNLEKTKEASSLLQAFSELPDLDSAISSPSSQSATRLNEHLATQLRFGGESSLLALKRESQEELQRRIVIYKDLITDNFLLDGMVINRNREGVPVDFCDSLLFSSLRYVSLVKLGYMQEAQVAWRAIEASEDPLQPGHWFRHPRCKENPTSRDMIVGLVAALSLPSTPSRAKHLADLINYISSHNGFISDGPVYVSLLSSGELDLLRLEAEEEGLHEASLPLVKLMSISSAELDALFLQTGFTSHLFGLTLWTEGELSSHETKGNQSTSTVRTIVKPLNVFFSAIGLQGLAKLRLPWMSLRLLEIDESNLFYQWLALRSSGALNQKTNTLLVNELLAMPQFPRDHLPTSCERDADYLWQRDSLYWDDNQNAVCTLGQKYNGVDFLWMATLLKDR